MEKNYIIVDESEAVNEDGTVKDGYEKRAYCCVKLTRLAEEAAAQAAQIAAAEKKQLDITAAKEAISSMSSTVDKGTDIEGLKKAVNELIKQVQVLVGAS